MPDTPEQSTIEQQSLTPKERIGAVLGTLRKNRTVQIDTAITAASALLIPGWGLLFAPAAGVARSWGAQELNSRRRQESINQDSGSYKMYDTKTGFGYLIDAWKTGKTQLPVSQNGATDSVDAYQRYQPPKP
jgi:hypothetical protein